MKKILVSLAVGAFLGMVVGTWIGPAFLSWFASPAIPNAFNCTREVDWAMSRLIWTQAIAGLVGAVLAAVVGAMASRALAQRAARKAAEKAAASPPPAQL